MSTPALQRTANYRTLRCAYDIAFHQLANELRRLTELQNMNGSERVGLTAAEAGIEVARKAYLETRNALADYLLSKQDGALRRFSLVRPDPEQQAFIQECAYFIWENSGKPSGSDQAHWYRAEAHRAS